MMRRTNKLSYTYGSSFRALSDFFDIPFESSALHIYIADKVLSPAKLYSIDCIKAKMFGLEYAGDYDDDDDEEDEFERREKIVFIPLLHTLK